LWIEIDVDIVSGALPRFAAKGRLIVPGPDVTATVETENAYKSLDLLIDKLDRMLRKRRTAVLRRRLKGDLRRFIPVVTNATTAAARPC
jgi:putative sigma-54 modulation protein